MRLPLGAGGLRRQQAGWVACHSFEVKNEKYEPHTFDDLVVITY